MRSSRDGLGSMGSRRLRLNRFLNLHVFFLGIRRRGDGRGDDELGDDARGDVGLGDVIRGEDMGRGDVGCGASAIGSGTAVAGSRETVSFSLIVSEVFIVNCSSFGRVELVIRAGTVSSLVSDPMLSHAITASPSLSPLIEEPISWDVTVIQERSESLSGVHRSSSMGLLHELRLEWPSPDSLHSSTVLIAGEPRPQNFKVGRPRTLDNWTFFAASHTRALRQRKQCSILP